MDPSLKLNLPAGHSLHNDSPATSAYVPGPHDVQAFPPDAKLYVPGGQFVHALLPALFVYVPEAHGWQLLAEVEPVTVPKVPERQGVHCEAPTLLS